MKKYRNIILIYILGMLAYGCTKEQDNSLLNEQVVLGCLSDHENGLDLNLHCEKPDNSRDYFSFNFVPIEPINKYYFPEFCKDLDNLTTFIDSKGDSTTLVVTEKKYYKATFTNNQFGCIDDVNGFTKYCIPFERAYIQMEGDKFKLRINLRSTIEPDTAGNVFFGNIMSVSDLNENLNIFTYAFDDEDNQLLDEKHKVYYDTIRLNDRLFENVYSYGNLQTTTLNQRVFYNTDLGIIGLKDSLNNLWIEQ